MLATGTTTRILDTALAALQERSDWRVVLDALPVPVYTTDAEGTVTHWNQACVDLVGREPQAGADQWCVTWKLYSIAGDPIPHDQCPMARAIRERREIRNEIVIAERPDGRRVACRVFPTPYFSEQGEFEGAVNLFIDVTHEQAGELVEQAARCRRLARASTDSKVSEILATMARDYDASAATLANSES
jgi:PAS domain S-box-containing protein